MPETPEEIAAAARKYGMLPEDYRPHGDYGDYPDFNRNLSEDARHHLMKYDMPEFHRNWNEVVSVNMSLIACN